MLVSPALPLSRSFAQIERAPFRAFEQVTTAVKTLRRQVHTPSNTLYIGIKRQMSWTLLCVSKSSPAQVTRNLILERAGYSVLSASEPEQATAIFNSKVVHAVVVGDSLQPDQRLELARTFKRLNKSVPIVVLSKSSGTQVPAGIVDEQLESLGDPRLLLEALARLLPQDGNKE